jgi:hypothetical protein
MLRRQARRCGRMIEVTRPAIAEHPFLRGMPSGHLDALA